VILFVEKISTFTWIVTGTAFEIRKSSFKTDHDRFFVVRSFKDVKLTKHVYLTRDVCLSEHKKKGQSHYDWVNELMFDSVAEALGVLQLYVDNQS